MNYWWIVRIDGAFHIVQIGTMLAVVEASHGPFWSYNEANKVLLKWLELP